MACGIVNVYPWKYRGFPYVRGLAVSWRVRCICSRVCTRTSTHVHVHVYLQRRESHGKAKNTFRINCRAGIPRRCAEQNAATLCSTYKRRENGKRKEGWLVGRSVGFDGTPEGTERLVKMQTSRFGVDAGREKSRAGRCAIRCCRFACATSKKLNVNCENGKRGKRRQPA